MTHIDDMVFSERLLPVPPKELRNRVTGTPIESVFRAVGHQIAADLQRVFAAAGRPLGVPGSAVLDFGCGCGRVLRHLGDVLNEATLHGVDIDADAITWCAAHLGALGSFSVVDRRPPLPFADATFDEAYGVSVFTHLTAADQAAWLPELHRVLRPGGTLVLTVLGSTALTSLSRRLAERVAAAGAFYVHDGGTEGLPDWYQTCFHTEEYVRREWSQTFDLVAYLPGAVCRSHDAVILTRRRN